MDDPWQMRCRSAWGLSESMSPARQPLAPILSPSPPMVATAQVFPAASVEQMDANRCKIFYPFIPREGNGGDQFFIQDGTGFSSSHSIPCASSKTDMGNSFRNFLSGPGSAYSVGNVASDLNVCNIFTPYNHVTDMAKNNEDSSHRQSSLHACGYSLPICNDVIGSSSRLPRRSADKLRFQAHQGSERDSVVSSSNYKNGLRLPMSNIFSCQTKELEPRTSIPSHMSSFIRGCPRVFCLDKVGDLFVSDDGLLGVYCLCHDLRMSVAKFCEHAGLYAVNPGNAVILENGETVAQWRRLFFLNLGVSIPDDANGWDWANAASASGVFDRSNVNTLLSSRTNMSFQSHHPLDEVRRPDLLPNSQQSYYPLEECSMWEKLPGNFESTKQRDFIGSIHCGSSGVVNESLPKEAKKYSQQSIHSIVNSGSVSRKHNCGRKLMSNCEFGENISTLNPNCVPEKSFVGDSYDNGAGNSRIYHFVDRDSTLSSVELRLGQPSQQNHLFTMSTTPCHQQPVAEVSHQKQLNHSNFKSTLPKHAQKTILIPSEFTTSTVDLRHQTHNPEKQNEHQAVKPGVDCNVVIPLMPSHFSVSEGQRKLHTVVDVIFKDHNLDVTNLSRDASAEYEIASYQRGKELIASPEDEFYVMKQCAPIETKVEKDLRAPDEPGNLSFYRKKSSHRMANNICIHQPASRALEDSDYWDESDLSYRTARASLSASPKISFFSSKTVTASDQVSSLSKSMYHEKVQQLEGNETDFSLSREMNVKKLHFSPSVDMTRNTFNEVLATSEDLSPTEEKLRVTCQSPRSCCKCGSSDLAANISVKTGLSGSVQDNSLCSSETQAKYPLYHAYNSEQLISRLYRTESQIADQMDDKILYQKERKLVHSKCSKEQQIFKKKITSNSSGEFRVCSKGHKIVAPAYHINHLTLESKNTTLGQCDYSLSGHDKDFLTNEFKSEVITADSINNRLICSGDKVCDGNCYQNISSKDKILNNVYRRCSAYVVADVSVEDNNLENNLVLDEGSAVEKCGSSDDVLEYGKRPKYGSCSSLRFNPSYENDLHSSGLNLNKKLMPGRKRDQSNLESTSKRVVKPFIKKKKAPKWKKLDDSFPASGAVDKANPSCHSKLKCSSDKIELSAHLRSLKRLSGFNTENTSHSKNCETCKTMKSLVAAERKKKRNFSPQDKEERKALDTNHEQTGVLTVDIICHRDRLPRPVVDGNYGIICNGNMHGKSKPVKIVSLASLLTAVKRCPITQNAEGRAAREKIEMKFDTKLNPRTKENRKRKLSDLTGHWKDEICTPSVPILGDNQSVCSTQIFEIQRTVDKCAAECHQRKISKRILASNDCNVDINYQDRRKPTKFRPSNSRKFDDRYYDSDAFCCVCGSSKKEDANSLLECSSCSIKVHQACYGITKIPKGRWSCRPCRRNSKNIACVLCGYGDGAMTRALRSRNIIKGLLKVWKYETECKPLKTNRLLSCDVTESKPFSEVHNSITAGARDPNIMQWIHVVCGLWTPGTRCPNVNTMSAFDVSGVLGSTRRTVCSICNREGGSSIKCRIEDCSVHFHPWCAHQKGLLQSETEGIDDESVGFYGRCLLHATHHNYLPALESPHVKEFSCARIEGFKGRERGYSYISAQNPASEGCGFVVPAEQLNTWLHISGQKLSERRPQKPVSTETEYDYRRMYTHYRKMKGWKHLVVFKSRIHGLGLYTSWFIPHGGVVVEYVGEIVGLRVADKREMEYQSGKKLQYKSACYFFRIDKESIIDATRKGGIARFVNHSCLPNCVAKVITMGNDKKVVFFAERDIKPGEEITYDYNFNHEEEGKKIPCFCRSKNCRRYLN